MSKTNLSSNTILKVRNDLQERINEMKDLLKNATNSVERKSPLRNLEAYEFALFIIQNISDDVVLEIPRDKSNGYNIGALVEVAVKHFLTGDTHLRMATSNETDLDRERMNEIKAWSSVNRNPNAMENPFGFIAVSRNGVHYINKATIEKYWNEFSNKGNRKTISRKMLETIIENENPTVLKMLSEKLGF